MAAIAEVLAATLNLPEVFTESDSGVDWPDSKPMRLRLEGLFGDANYYPVIFDASYGEDGVEVAGSIADDLSDIFSDLAIDLATLEADALEATDWFRSSFVEHWGRHAVHLAGALYSLYLEGSFD